MSARQAWRTPRSWSRLLMPYQRTRPFGPYTELLLIARKAFERKHGCEIVIDASCKIGVPIWRDGGLSFGNYKMFYCHPVDYIWACLGKDIFFADQVAQHWIQWNIEYQAEKAMDRLAPLVRAGRPGSGITFRDARGQEVDLED